MCHHCFVVHGDVKICHKCGLTILPNGKTFYDTKLKNRKEVRKNEKDRRLS